MPRAGPDDIIIEVECCGICAGDSKAYDGAPSFWGDKEQPAYIKAPMIPGHEFVGIAVELGENIARRGEFHLGERLISEQIVPCEECRFCKSGQYWMRERHDVYGFQNNVNGAMAKYMRLPATSRTHKVPNNMPLERAALIEPYACSVHAVNPRPNPTRRLRRPLWRRAARSRHGGRGPVEEPVEVCSARRQAGRLEIAKRFGADLVMNPLKEDVVKIIKEMTGGYGCDVYIEATGHPSSVVQGLKMIRKRGRFVEFSVFGQDVTVDWSIISDRKELDLYGSHPGRDRYPFTIAAIDDGRLPTEGVVTHRMPLGDFQKGIDMMHKGDGSIKIVLIP